MKGRRSNRRGLRVQAPFGSSMKILGVAQVFIYCRSVSHSFALATAAGGVFKPHVRHFSLLHYFQVSRLFDDRRSAGIEPATDALLMRCSTRLSYRTWHLGIEPSGEAFLTKPPWTTCLGAPRFQVAAYKKTPEKTGPFAPAGPGYPETPACQRTPSAYGSSYIARGVPAQAFEADFL